MKINNVNNTSFKGVYRVDNGNATTIMGVKLSDPEKYKFPNNNGTETLYKIFNPNGDNDHVLLIQKGSIKNCVHMNFPSLILTDDDSLDATSYKNFKKEFEDSVSGLYKKTTEELKKMLKRKEIKAARQEAEKNPFSSASPFRDELIGKIRANLFYEVGSKEDNLYEILLKKSTVITPEGLEKLQNNIFDFIGKIVKKA